MGRNIFLGTQLPPLRAMHLKRGVDLVVGEKVFFEGSESEAYCKAHNIPYKLLEEERDLYRFLAGEEPIDLCFVSNFSIILQDDFIARCRWIVNFHPGDIYRFRGRLPLVETILHGCSFCALTAHLIDSAKIDSGPIVAQVRIPLDYSLNYLSNEKRLLSYLEPMANSILDNLEDTGNIPSEPWSPEKGTYYPVPSKETLIQILSSPNLDAFPKKS